jgi:hypothetical protein
VPVERLSVKDAVITDGSKRVTYGELIGGKRFNVALTGNNINATTGVAKVKPVQELKIVGQSPQRYDGLPPEYDDPPPPYDDEPPYDDDDAQTRVINGRHRRGFGGG